MLKQKDKIILEHLFAYSRFTSKQLAKITNLTQQAVYYRIKQLEEKKYILRYDAIINWNALSVIKEIYYIKTKDVEDLSKELIKEKPVFGINEVIGNSNLVVWCFFRSKTQQKEFQSKLRRYKWESINVKDAIFPQTSVFDIPVKLNVPKIKENKIRLDKKDIAIMKYLADGHARDSVKTIGDKLNLSYDIVYYRLRNLISSGFFFRLMAQIGFESLELKLSMINIKLKRKSNINAIIEKLKKLKFFTIILSDKEDTLHLHIFSQDAEDYWKKIENVIFSIGDELENINQFYIKSTPLLNRYPLEFLINKTKINQ